MKEKTTIQDIADALGLSRNTVSKAINNTGVLADATRERILEKAIEMGYKQFAYVNSVAEASAPVQPQYQGEIALLTTMFLGNSHFSSTMLDKFQQDITREGYSMTMHRVTPDNIADLTLPISLQTDRTKAILCIEIFDDAYSRMLCDLGIPILFVDGPASALSDPLPADMLMMNNTSGILSLVKEMADRGITRIGFIGEINHCVSFMERYLAFRNAMFLNGLVIDEKFCLTDIPSDPQNGFRDYINSLFSSLSSLEELPQLFICANDFVAIDTLGQLKKLGLKCPKDVMVCGFDDSPESRVTTPRLTTCHIHSQIMGYSASKLLLSRIHQPNLNFRSIYTETDLKYRESTRG